jgi:divalent metal cation (Fe/Co/Zn/Cd) transporter
MNLANLSALIAVIGALTVLVNLLTEVVKKATWNKVPTDLLVVLLSELLTLASGAAYVQMHSISIQWYTVVAAVVVGLLVAYGAMFGFDKLKEALSRITVGSPPEDDSGESGKSV